MSALSAMTLMRRRWFSGSSSNTFLFSIRGRKRFISASPTTSELSLAKTRLTRTHLTMTTKLLHYIPWMGLWSRPKRRRSRRVGPKRRRSRRVGVSVANSKGSLPVARKLAEKVFENCHPKLKPYSIETFKSLWTTSGDYSKIVGSICQVTSDTTEHKHDSGEHAVFEELKPEAAVEANMMSEKSVVKATSNDDDQNLKDDPVGIDSLEKNKDISLPALELPRDESNKLETEIDKPEAGVKQLAKRKRGRPEHSSNTSEASRKTKIDTDKEPYSEDKSIKSVTQASSVAPPDETVERRGWPDEEKETNGTVQNSASVPRQAISSEKNEFDALLSSEEKPLKCGQKFDTRGESSPKSQDEKPKEGKTYFIIQKDLPGETSKKKKALSGKSSEKSESKNPKPLDPTTKSNRKLWEKEGEKNATIASEEPSDKDLGENLTASKIEVFFPEDEAFYEGTVDSYDASPKKHKDEVKSGTTAKTKTGEEAKEATPKAGSQSKDATSQSSKSKDATLKSEYMTFSAYVSGNEEVFAHLPVTWITEGDFTQLGVDSGRDRFVF